MLGCAHAKTKEYQNSQDDFRMSRRKIEQIGILLKDVFHII